MAQLVNTDTENDDVDNIDLRQSSLQTHRIKQFETTLIPSSVEIVTNHSCRLVPPPFKNFRLRFRRDHIEMQRTPLLGICSTTEGYTCCSPSELVFGTTPLCNKMGVGFFTTRDFDPTSFAVYLKYHAGRLVLTNPHRTLESANCDWSSGLYSSAFANEGDVQTSALLTPTLLVPDSKHKPQKRENNTAQSSSLQQLINIIINSIAESRKRIAKKHSSVFRNKCYTEVSDGDVETPQQVHYDVTVRGQSAKHLCQTNVLLADLHELTSLRKVAAVRCGTVGSHLI
ncbi:unnamed protein product [Taenia asiatica]|uniref:IRS-type PTB domain-containing protein n=1 Tax=Taenia asiatica TaxID=60517 RepID=A0A0R3W8R5_TAEAS|nr:unnamed protein product [Taenia asiatica]